MHSGEQGESASRGQSQTIGVVLLVAVAIIVVALLAVFVLDFSDEQTDESVVLAVESDMNGSTLTIRHAGGDVIQTDTVTVVIDGTDSRRHDLVDFNGLRTGDQFGAGDRASRSLDTNSTWLADGFRVTVVHDPTNAVLHETFYDGLDTAALNITSTAFPSAVTAGDTATVDYTVENTGEIDGTGPVALVHENGTTVDTDTVSLTPGETTAGTLSYTTNADDAPAVDLAVETGDDTEAATVTVDAPAFALTGSTFPGEVDAGNDSTVAFTVNNTGTASGSTTVALRRNGTTVDTTAVSLTPGENTTETLAYTTAPADTPAIALTVDTGDDTAEANVTVNETAAVFTLTDTTFPAEVEPGDDIQVDYTVNNTGGTDGTTAVDLVHENGTSVTAQSQSLAPGENASGTLTYTAVAGDAPAVNLTVDTGDDNATERVNVSGSSPLTVYVGSLDSSLYALHASNGSKDWEFTAPSNKIRSSPTVVDGTVYHGSWDSTLYAVNASTGTQEWTFEEPSGRVQTGPTVADGTVYAGSETGTLYAVDAETGAKKWAFPGPTDEVWSSPTVSGGTVYVGSRDGTLYAVDAATGTEEWAFTEPGAKVQSSPTVDGGTVYVGSHDGTLYAVNATTGTKEWGYDAGAAISSSPNVVGGTLYVGAFDATLYAIDPATGAEQWTYTGPSDTVHSSPNVVDGTVYVGSHDSTLYAVNATTGTEEWQFTNPSGQVRSTPTVYNGTVYVGSNDGTLYAVDTQSGDKQWAFTDPGDWVNSSPTVVTDPESGDSVGSRVQQELLGHHDE